MIVDPSDIVGRNRRQENSNAMVSECEVNMGMVGIDSIHVERNGVFGGVPKLHFKAKKTKKSSKFKTNTHPRRFWYT